MRDDASRSIESSSDQVTSPQEHVTTAGTTHLLVPSDSHGMTQSIPSFIVLGVGGWGLGAVTSTPPPPFWISEAIPHTRPHALGLPPMDDMVSA